MIRESILIQYGLDHVIHSSIVISLVQSISDCLRMQNSNSNT